MKPTDFLGRKLKVGDPVAYIGGFSRAMLRTSTVSSLLSNGYVMLADGGVVPLDRVVKALYENTPTVVCVMVRDFASKKLLLVRRNNEPGVGLLALPGGYQMAGETWQEAGARELYEETGFMVDSLKQAGKVETDEYGNNLIFGVAALGGKPKGTVDLAEVQELVFVDDLPPPEQWAFARHYAAAKYARSKGQC